MTGSSLPVYGRARRHVGDTDVRESGHAALRWLPGPVFVAAAAFSACAYVVPGFDVAYRSVLFAVGTEAFGAVVGLALAFVLIERPRQLPRLADLLVAVAFLIGTVSSLLFVVVPTAYSQGQVSRFSAWSSAS